MRKLFPLLTLFATGTALGGADPRGDNPGSQPSSPEEERRMFHLPPGFEIQLVAAEPQIQKPINFNFDTRGRIWVTGSEQYPWPAQRDALGEPIPGFEQTYAEIAATFAKGATPPPPSKDGHDSVRILSDFDASGRAQKMAIFAEGLNIPGGIQPLPRPAGAKGDAAIVYSIPYIWRMEDTTGSGRADKKERLFGPFGFLDTHGGSASYIEWIDGWIYGTHGFRNHSEVGWLKSANGGQTVLDSGNTYRFRPDGSAFEYFTHGQTNPFGLTFDPSGNLYSADSHSRPVYLLLKGAYYEGIGKQDDGLGFAPRITDDDHGSTAIGGIAYYADDKWPEEYRGNLFNGNPVTRRVNRDRLEWHGSTPKAIRQPDFIVSDDPWFRPVQVKLGPDGALYIADFYNAIIGHYEVPLTDPHRDHIHGRIWRVTYTGQKAEVPDLAALATADLVEKLRDPNLEVRRLATNELVEARGKEAANLLEARFVEGEPDPSLLWRAHARWVLNRLGSELRGLAPGFYPFTANDPLAREHFDGFVLKDKWNDPSLPAANVRATLEAWERFEPRDLPDLLDVWKRTTADDLELIHTVRMIVRNLLQGHPEAFALAAKLPSDQQDRVADVCLGAPTAPAADFLLGYLRGRDFAVPRAGEYMRQVALYLEPAGRLGEVVAALEKLSGAPLSERMALAGGLNEASRRRGLALPPAAEKWIEQALLDGLGSENGLVVSLAIAALRDLHTEAKLEPLRKIVLDPKGDARRRAAALEALFDCATGPEVAADTLANAHTLSLRKRAAELLGQRGAPSAEPLVKALATAPSELATSIAGALARTDAGAEALLAAVTAGHAAPALLRNNAVAGPLSSRPPALIEKAAELTNGLPPENTRLDQLIAQRAAEYRQALSRPPGERPNPERGQQIFLKNCAVCHRVKGQGGNIGPALDGVGARGIERLLEDILDPNRNVDPAFRQVIVETTDGRTLAGLHPHQSGELLLLSDAEGKETSVSLTQVKSQTMSTISLMPPVFEQTLTGPELGDLASWLLETTKP